MTNYTLPESHEAKERQWVLENVPMGGIFIDVGADTGTWTIPLSSFFSEVYAIEPSPTDAQDLIAALMVKGISNVTVIRKAASSEVGEIYLSAGADEPEWFSSFTKPEAPYNYSILVETMKIDDLGLKPRLIKVDVEGWGVEVFKGAMKTLYDTEYVIFEIHDAKEENFANQVLNVGFERVHISDSGSILYYKRRVDWL